jgi:hypothetical protein
LFLLYAKRYFFNKMWSQFGTLKPLFDIYVFILFIVFVNPRSTAVEALIDWSIDWLIDWGNRITRRKPPICRKSLHDKLYHIMLYTSPWSRFELTTSVVIGTDCIGSCESIYHTITATKGPMSYNDNYVTVLS